MADKLKIFTGESSLVEENVNRFLEQMQGHYTRVVMAGDKDNLVLGIMYTDKSKEYNMYW